MRPDYKNWMPRGMVVGFFAGAILFLLAAILFNTLVSRPGLRSALAAISFVAGIILFLAALWCLCLYCAFDYNGKRRLAKTIIEGVASHVEIKEGGKGLDVGCGSGALAIAVAKRNPQASFIGIDRWGREYASFSKSLCESNAKAENVSNVTFQIGDAIHLDFPDESFDAVFSNYVYHNIPVKDRQALILETLRTLKKGGHFAIHDIFSRHKYGDMEAFIAELKEMGYEKVELIPTAKGLWIGRHEALFMELSGSALLTGIK